MKLPPMNSLRVFEAVSRLGGVSKAAQELCVSQGAISQQIRNLEDHLGRDLFIRRGNSLELSEDGESFSRVVHAALVEIANAAGEIARERDDAQLLISTWAGFAVKWLMPNLGGFYAAHPGVTVALDQSTRVVNFRNDGIDAAIRFGECDSDALNSVLLFQPSVRAVASPGYIERNGPMADLSNPGDHVLIDHFYPTEEIRSQHIHWQDVLGEGVEISRQRYLSFPDEQQAVNAALQGQGISLSSTHTIEQELKRGEIVFAAPGFVPARGAIHFVWPKEKRPKQALFWLRDWLVESLARYRA